MIYTVTTNPALDYVMITKKAALGQLNRASRELHFCGGKGINISVVLNHMGVPSICLGFVSGYVGDEIERELQREGCKTDFIHLAEGCTRINVKLKESNGRETEINGNGPKIDAEHQEQLLRQAESVGEDDILILSGNIPDEMPEDFYAQMAARATGRGAKLVVDAEKRLLLPTLQYHPLLVKPNQKELEGIVSQKIRQLSDLQEAAGCLQRMGAIHVLVSLGKKGAYFLDSDGKGILLDAPRGTVINTVGSGDSMVAGFLCRYLQGETAVSAAAYGVAAGSARAFSERFPEKKEIDVLYEGISYRTAQKKGA
ncbi:MAG: 1-phosphofructokinase [Lachnospiraceae bacterium]|nr:1-phosphofructokinase [Lachnospiraceae bacterium]